MGQPVPIDDLPENPAIDPGTYAIRNEAKTSAEVQHLKKIFQQESGAGKNTATSNAGAVGYGQILPDTFKQVAEPGWDINNAYHNARASARYALEQLRKAGNDVVAGAAGYYGGDGGRIKAQKGIAVSDPRNPNAPNTLEYGKQVASRNVSNPVPADDLPEAPSQFAEDPHTAMQHIPSPEEVARDQYWQEVASRGPEAMARLQRVEQMSPLSKLLTSAGNETIKFGLGAKEIGSGIGGLISDLAGMPNAEKFFTDKMIEAGAQNAEMNKTTKEFNENSGIPGFIGKTLPYIVSQESLGVPITAKTQAALNVAKEVPKAVGRESRKIVVPTINKLASKNIPYISAAAKDVKRVITDPWIRNAARKAAQVPYPNPYRKGVAANIIGSTILGGIEGGLHPDNTAAIGALSSAQGAILGNALKPALTNAPNYRTDAEKELIEWGKDQGMKFLPGMETGTKRLQKFEHGLRNDTTFADPLHRVDMANAVVANRVAFKAMGIPEKQIDIMTPEKLSKHLDDLGKQYDEIEKGTVAYFRPQDKLAIGRHLEELKKDTTKAGQQIYKDALDIKLQLDRASPHRNPLTGQIQSMVMDGSPYKNIRKRLQTEINDSYTKGDTLKAEAYKPLLKELDDAVERGVAQKHGTATVAKWKDLNERYAMSNLIIEHGMSPTGMFDASRLMPHLLNNDAKRLLTGKGGRIRDLQKLVKLEYMAKHQMGSDLSGIGSRNVYNPSNMGVVEKLLLTPAGGYVPVIPELATWLYTKGFPSKTGLLNMSGKGFGNPALYTRAIGAAHKPLATVYEHTVQPVVDTVDEAQRKLEKYMKKYRLSDMADK